MQSSNYRPGLQSSKPARNSEKEKDTQDAHWEDLMRKIGLLFSFFWLLLISAHVALAGPFEKGPVKEPKVKSPLVIENSKGKVVFEEYFKERESEYEPYYLGDEDYAGDYMERQSIDLSLFARQRIHGNFFVEGMVGRSFGRSYTQYSGDETITFGIPLITFGDERTPNNVTFKDGMIFTLKLIFNMKVPE